MNPELANSLFIRARDRFEGSDRLRWIVVLIGLVFHITTFYPFITISQAMEQVQAERRHLQELKPGVQKLRIALDKLAKSSDIQISDALGGLHRSLIDDFQAMSRAVEIIKGPLPPQGIDLEDWLLTQFQNVTPPMGSQMPPIQMPMQNLPPDARRTPPAPPIQMPMQNLPPSTLAPSQMPQIQTPITQMWEPMSRETPRVVTSLASSPGVVRELREAQNSTGLRQVLLPLVEAEIIQPRFADLNQRLQETVRPEIMQQAESIYKAALRYGAAYPQWAALWRQLEQAMTEAQKAAKALAIHAPVNDTWWTTVASKGDTLDSLGAQAVESLLPPSTRDIGERIDRLVTEALDQQARIEADLSRTIEDLKVRFEKQQAQLSGLGTPLEWVTLKLDFVAPIFPLLLALMIAALSLTTSLRIRELAQAVNVLPDSPAIWAWFFQRVTGTMERGVSVDASVIAKLRWSGLWSLLAALLWVAIAAWQVAMWQQVRQSSAAVMLLIASIALISVYAYRLRVMDEVFRLRLNSSKQTA